MCLDVGHFKFQVLANGWVLSIHNFRLCYTWLSATSSITGHSLLPETLLYLTWLMPQSNSFLFSFLMAPIWSPLYFVFWALCFSLSLVFSWVQPVPFMALNAIDMTTRPRHISPADFSPPDHMCSNLVNTLHFKLNTSKAKLLSSYIYSPGPCFPQPSGLHI